MAAFYNELDDDLRAFIAEQKIFFVATAPADGRINLSPKGMDTLRCLDPRTVAFLNLTGSGNETEAHLLENGRMTLMWCSFGRKPLILRAYGTGRSVRPRDPDWGRIFPLFEPIPGARQIILLDIDSIQTSCGYAVPFFEFRGERDTLRRWAEHKGRDGLEAYWQEKNRTSIDGLATRVAEV